ncbi:MAG: chloride channel protein, partial [Desulfobacteraceae bacterium]|nr:chloride channel protein [Desulfobacteraceae bacterium]
MAWLSRLKILLNPSRWIWFRMDDRLVLIAFGAAVGICSGVAAVALNRGLIFMVGFLALFRDNWWIFVIPGIGMAASSLFLEKVVREGAGHGV